MVTVQQVAQAIAGAVEKGRSGERYPIGGINREWKEMLEKIIGYMGLEKKVVTIPTFLAKLYAITLRRKHKKENKESGLEPVAFMDLQSKKTFIDPEPVMRELGYLPDDLDRAMKEAILECVR
jgi:nucleoside-diphosphate-sugar epimerase